MTANVRIKGVALTLKLGATDYKTDVTACEIDNVEADGDVTTFEDAAGAGARKWLMKLSAIQSTDTASLWSYIWTASGTTVAYVYAPHGNAVASAAQPHFTGNVKIGPKPKIGGAAGASNTYVFDAEWECTGEPTRVTTGE